MALNADKEIINTYDILFHEIVPKKIDKNISWCKIPVYTAGLRLIEAFITYITNDYSYYCIK